MLQKKYHIGLIALLAAIGLTSCASEEVVMDPGSSDSTPPAAPVAAAATTPEAKPEAKANIAASPGSPAPAVAPAAPPLATAQVDAAPVPGSAPASAPIVAKTEIPANATPEDLRAIIGKLDSKIEFLETKLSASAKSGKITTSAIKAQVAAGHPAEPVGTRVFTRPTKNDPESGFVHDEAIQSYRDATILFESQKYPEAVLAFSSFLEHYPDHALAGAAQYYVGLSYFRQKEYKLAIEEFRRVLTSYDRSTHISETLRDLAAAEEAQKQPEAARHRQLLSSLFPASPAAAISQEAAPAPVAAPVSAMDPAVGPAETTPAATPPTSFSTGDSAPPTAPVTIQMNSVADPSAPLAVPPAAPAATTPVAPLSSVDSAP
ncbi:MAG: tetratricopeptide repeat protein, partial [Bdellovibrionota bacterium]